MRFNQSLGSFFSFWENFPASVSKVMNNDSIGSNLHDGTFSRMHLMCTGLGQDMFCVQDNNPVFSS